MGITKTFRRKNIRLPRPNYSGHQWYFLTACTQNRIPHLQGAELVSQHLVLLAEQAQRGSFNVPAYCFMPDHLHLLVSGLKDDSNCLAFMRTFKQRSGLAFWRSSEGRLWQHKFYDHILRPQDQWESVAYYIWMNPVRKGLCARPEEWPFSGSQTMDWKTLMRAPCRQWSPPWK
jgi:putative transposase